jgi:hypothetical protein
VSQPRHQEAYSVQRVAVGDMSMSPLILLLRHFALDIAINVPNLVLIPVASMTEIQFVSWNEHGVATSKLVLKKKDLKKSNGHMVHSPNSYQQTRIRERDTFCNSGFI